MGSYVPADKNPRPRNISRALLEAERDHLLDCPTAEYPIRAAAFMLDAILCIILWKGLDSLCAAIGTYLYGMLVPAGLPPEEGLDPRAAMPFLAYVLKMTMLYLNVIWCEVRHGGSPAKLLLGLRVIDARTGYWLTLPRALLREVVGKVASAGSVVGAMMPLFRPDRRAMHDLLSDSIVKRLHWNSTDAKPGGVPP